MEEVRRFVGQLTRLGLIIIGILAGRAVLVRTPMVAELAAVPGIGISAYDLVTAAAYLAILLVLVGFVRHVEDIVAQRPGAFPWQTLLAHTLILGGVVIGYGVLRPFAASLLGSQRYWLYAAALLILSVAPVFGIGKVIYDYASQRIERWES